MSVQLPPCSVCVSRKPDLELNPGTATRDMGSFAAQLECPARTSTIVRRSWTQHHGRLLGSSHSHRGWEGHSCVCWWYGCFLGALGPSPLCADTETGLTSSHWESPYVLDCIQPESPPKDPCSKCDHVGGWASQEALKLNSQQRKISRRFQSFLDRVSAAVLWHIGLSLWKVSSGSPACQPTLEIQVLGTNTVT